MKNEADVILILDSLVDDTYYVWECFSTFQKYSRSSGNKKDNFCLAFQTAWENKFIDFYTGPPSEEDQALIPEFVLTDQVIGELLNFPAESCIKVTVATSDAGCTFLKKNRKKYYF